MFFSLLVLISISSAAASPLLVRNPVTTINGTADNSFLKTWWHETAEFNWKTPVSDGNVRESHQYYIQIATAGPPSDEIYYDSFVYETIPRSGNGNILRPNDPTSITTGDDGITIEPDINMTMAWTSFLYTQDARVMISRLDGTNITEDDFVIRPSTLDFPVSVWRGDLYIDVPYSSSGQRFSVEFNDNLWEFRNNCNTTACAYVQNVNPKGTAYTSSYQDSNAIMGVEPRDALLIFASPFETPDTVPDPSAASSLVVSEGLVTGLDTTDASTVIFNPGVYYLSSTNHALLSSCVNWVYLAPGAYVKGAIEFQTEAETIKFTGHGVLSGEQYVYQANPSQGYANVPSNEDSLRMVMGYSSYTTNQTLLINGPTINAPPFNSVDFEGDLDTISIDGSDYKQVGAFFAQTDGITLYSGSRLNNVFYHSNDDTIKTYFPNISVEHVVVWKGHTAPTIQFGWASRNLSDILVNDVDIIHSRYSTNGSHPSIIGANQIYQVSEAASNTAILSNSITDVVISNIRAEGISGGLFRICPLANFESFTIENVSIAEFPVGTTGIPVSQLPLFTDETGEAVSLAGFVVKGYQVNGTNIAFNKGNWASSAVGALNIAAAYMSYGGCTVE